MAGDSNAEFFRLNPFAAVLRQELRSLGRGHQVAFGTYAAERVLSRTAVSADAAKSTVVHSIARLLDRLWKSLDHGAVDEPELQQIDEAVGSIEVDEDGDELEWLLDPLGAIQLAAVAGTDDGSSAARAGAVPIDNLHQRLLTQRFGQTYSLSTADMAEALRRADDDPATESERRDLLDVIRFLRQRPDLSKADVAQLRMRARQQ